MQTTFQLKVSRLISQKQGDNVGIADETRLRALDPMEPAPAPADPLLERRRDGIATLTLNRPRQYNALSAALLERLHASLDARPTNPCAWW